MAYQIKCDGNLLYDHRDESLVVIKPKCNLELNRVGEASFYIDISHPYYDKLRKKRSIFEILQDNETIFRGRMTEDTRDFENTKYVDLEGVLSFFNDSIIRPFSFPEDFQDNADYVAAAKSGNVVEFFVKWLIDQHNSQVQEFQRFKLGVVTVRDPNNYLSRSSKDYLKTWEVLKEKLFESAIKGFLCIRYEEDGNYIDYLEDFARKNSQQITYGKNLLNLSANSNSSETYSAVIPLGKRRNEIDIESEDDSRITIEELPDGNITDDIVKSGDTIYSRSAVEEYGWVCAPTTETTWEDVGEAENLQTNGVDFLTDTGMKLSNTITITAVDLHYSDDEIESFRIYRKVVLLSQPHDQHNLYNLTRLEIDIHNPQNTVIIIGDTQLSLTDINAGIGQNVASQVEAGKSQILSDVNKIVHEQESVILQKSEELYHTKFEQLSRSITLELSGSLGNKAEIRLSIDGNEYKDEIDLAKVREAFANDKTAVTISAGVITFNSGTIVINSNNFSLDSSGHITANGATINGKVTTVSSAFMTELDKGSLRLYYDDVLCGTINTKYWSGAATEGISLRVEDGGNYIMFSHADDTQGSGYKVDYYLNAGWSSNYDEMHIFQTSARFLSDVYLDGKTDIGSLRLRGAGGKRYLVTANDNGTVTCSVL